MIRPLLPAALALVAAVPALAQQASTPDSGYAKGYADAPGTNDAAVNARQAPVTAALNADSNVAVTTSAADQARYEADRVEYQQAMMRHDAAIDRTAARYVHQQRAYADAMAAWRVQVQQCKAGHRRACDMPAPAVADFY